ncbi:uncharacterized protein DDB_G0286299-like [Eurosta solidaginis]|uniref:uncharacterized protein DDB_G0286299-like n=1 Tax=Eurosta solidaginis TaxID=178769 RepID=UPI003530F116
MQSTNTEGSYMQGNNGYTRAEMSERTEPSHTPGSEDSKPHIAIPSIESTNTENDILETNRASPNRNESNDRQEHLPLGAPSPPDDPVIDPPEVEAEQTPRRSTRVRKPKFIFSPTTQKGEKCYVFIKLLEERAELNRKNEAQLKQLPQDYGDSSAEEDSDDTGDEEEDVEGNKNEEVESTEEDLSEEEAFQENNEDVQESEEEALDNQTGDSADEKSVAQSDTHVVVDGNTEIQSDDASAAEELVISIKSATEVDNEHEDEAVAADFLEQAKIADSDEEDWSSSTKKSARKNKSKRQNKKTAARDEEVIKTNEEEIKIEPKKADPKATQQKKPLKATNDTHPTAAEGPTHGHAPQPSPSSAIQTAPSEVFAIIAKMFTDPIPQPAPMSVEYMPAGTEILMNKLEEDYTNYSPVMWADPLVPYSIAVDINEDCTDLFPAVEIGVNNERLNSAPRLEFSAFGLQVKAIVDAEISQTGAIRALKPLPGLKKSLACIMQSSPMLDEAAIMRLLLFRR